MLDALFPPVCPGCGLVLRSRGPLCAGCMREQQPLPPSRRREHDIHAVHPYDGPWRRALHRLKYDRALAWAGPLGRCLAQCSVVDSGWDEVVAVPLHWRRLIVRGFNQVEVILEQARRIRPGLPRARRLLHRPRAGQPQRGRSAAERRALAPETFRVRPRHHGAIAGRRVLVVDDVVTTGATLRTAMGAIRAAGAAQVEGLALLRSL